MIFLRLHVFPLCPLSASQRERRRSLRTLIGGFLIGFGGMLLFTALFFLLS